MFALPRQGKKLSSREKFSRFRLRLRDREWRRYGKLLLAGKAAGIGVVWLAITVVSGLFFGKAYASDAAVKAADIVNPINTVWVLLAAFLVFGMQVGFTMLEAGFCRSRETVNVLMECVVDTCLCGLLFYAWGFSFMFSHGNGFIGYELVLPARRACNLRRHGRGFPGILALPVRLRRHLLHDHLRRDDRPHGVGSAI